MKVPRAIKLIGLGGVGGIVARYLTLFLAARNGAVRLVLVDGDTFEPDNASRMYFPRLGNKAAVLRDELEAHVQGTRLTLVTVEEYLTPDNLSRLLHEGDVVILAVDNDATRKMVSDFCEVLECVCLISGGNDGVGEDANGQVLRGTFGNVQVYVRRGGRDVTPSLTYYHPEIAAPADRMPTDAHWADGLESSPQILFTNLTVAAAILNAFWLHASGALPYDEVFFDIAAGIMRPMKDV